MVGLQCRGVLRCWVTPGERGETTFFFTPHHRKRFTRRASLPVAPGACGVDFETAKDLGKLRLRREREGGGGVRQLSLQWFLGLIEDG